MILKNYSNCKSHVSDSETGGDSVSNKSGDQDYYEEPEYLVEISDEFNSSVFSKI